MTTPSIPSQMGILGTGGMGGGIYCALATLAHNDNEIAIMNYQNMGSMATVTATVTVTQLHTQIAAAQASESAGEEQATGEMDQAIAGGIGAGLSLTAGGVDAFSDKMASKDSQAQMTALKTFKAKVDEQVITPHALVAGTRVPTGGTTDEPTMDAIRGRWMGSPAREPDVGGFNAENTAQIDTIATLTPGEGKNLQQILQSKIDALKNQMDGVSAARFQALTNLSNGVGGSVGDTLNAQQKNEAAASTCTSQEQSAAAAVLETAERNFVSAVQAFEQGAQAAASAANQIAQGLNSASRG